MINLHRNFYVENILSELNCINSKDYKNLPYSENLNFLNNLIKEIRNNSKVGFDPEMTISPFEEDLKSFIANLMEKDRS